MLKLYHCREARSLRPLWTLEEMGLPYEAVLLPFPPRFLEKAYLDINPLGTVPYLIDGDVRMTESTAICLYLAERYQPSSLTMSSSEKEYPRFLNWLFFSDATLTFPQTIVLRYRQLEPPERRSERAAADYERWFFGRLRAVEAALNDGDWLCGGRFTIADIAVAYALHLGDSVVGLGNGFGPNVRRYLDRDRAASIQTCDAGGRGSTGLALAAGRLRQQVGTNRERRRAIPQPSSITRRAHAGRRS